MSDYLHSSGESEDSATPDQGLPGQGTSPPQGKRAVRRQRRRCKRSHGAQIAICTSSAPPLRGQRKIPDPPLPCRKTESFSNKNCQKNNEQEGAHNSSNVTKTACTKTACDRSDFAKPFWRERPFVRQGAEIYAALDLGTNNCRLLIATPTRPGRFRALDRFSRIIRLGQGIGTRDSLSDEAMERAIEALDICRDKLSQWPIRHQRLIATQACRLAANGAQFLERVRCQLGLDLEIVNRETEARLAVAGCSTLIERETQALVLFDIGGGSSEIALIDISARRSPRLAEHIVAWTSLPVGVVTLAERFGGTHVSVDDFELMKSYVGSLIDQFDGRNKLGHLVDCPSFHLLGTSGTMTTLAGLHLELERYDRRRIDGVWMGCEDVTRMTRRLLSWNMEQRMASPCIGPERADLVLAGCAILEAIRAHWPSRRVRVADRGLREGILMELMSHAHAWHR